MRTPSSLLPAFVLLLASACGGGDGGTNPGAVAASIDIEVDPGGAMTALGQTRGVRATVRSASGAAITSPVSWTSSATSVATVTSGGTSATVTAVGNGAATITAKAGDATGTVGVTVAQAVNWIQLTPLNTTIYLSGSPSRVTYAAVGMDANNHPVPNPSPAAAYSSDHPEVASIDPVTGVVTPHAAGTTTITATVGGRSSGGAGLRVEAQAPGAR